MELFSIRIQRTFQLVSTLEDRVQDLLSQMTLEEKTCQMATLYGSGRVLKDALPQDNWKTEVWKDGIGNIDEEHNLSLIHI